MSWSIGLNLGQSLLEIAAQYNSQLVKKRYFTTTTAAETAVTQFLQAHSVDKIGTIKICCPWPLHILLAEHGSPMAFLTTVGFENLLELAMPLKKPLTTCLWPRESPLLPREFVFGISERTNSQGHIERLPDESELEFLAAKLELHQIKNIAIGFLNSHLNSENETRVQKYFEAKGFHVFISSKKNVADERARFNFAALNAYVYPLWLERLQNLFKVLKPLLSENSEILMGDQKVSAEPSEWTIPPLDTAFAFYNHLGSHFALSSDFLYLGIEEFLLFPANENEQPVAETRKGILAAPNRPYCKTRLQPLSVIGKGFFTDVSFRDDEINFEPGPMVFGRGLTPTFFDLMVDKIEWQKCDGLKEKVQTRGLSRLDEQLTAYARNSGEDTDFNSRTLKARLWEIAEEIMTSEMASHRRSTNMTLCGPLAPAFAKVFQCPVMGDEFFAVSSFLLGPK